MTTWQGTWNSPTPTSNIQPTFTGSAVPSVTYASGQAATGDGVDDFYTRACFGNGMTAAQAIASLATSTAPAAGTMTNVVAPPVVPPNSPPSAYAAAGLPFPPFILLTLAQCQTTVNSAGNPLIVPIFGFDNGGGFGIDGTNLVAVDFGERIVKLRINILQRGTFACPSRGKSLLQRFHPLQILSTFCLFLTMCAIALQFLHLTGNGMPIHRAAVTLRH